MEDDRDSGSQAPGKAAFKPPSQYYYHKNPSSNSKSNWSNSKRQDIVTYGNAERAGVLTQLGRLTKAMMTPIQV